MALEESKSIPYQQYEMARAELAKERLVTPQVAYAQTAESHDRINQVQHHINTLESQKKQLCDERNQMQARINQMQAWLAQKAKQTALQAQRGATEGGNDLVPPDVLTVTHTATMGWHAERPLNLFGAQPRWGCDEFKS
ncbi:hypothetical protein DQ04_09221000 [Trypanosoma grayi]|uniref:hypothetical protein n=1 Tax=Trypanosoma grayi TaxID=71804 RepID=UPI0004F4041E|nr:hypothetical protein DQ04_09221000 [Trypanosoma grayi]KEG07632.1 hypothetical protein DQ04_09221000 [Trypanosoma grayi]